MSEGGQASQGSPHGSPTSSAAPARPRPDHKHRNSSASLASLIKRDSNQSLPTHLISSSSQPKSSVKQQLPMKLAKVGSSGSSSGSSQGSMGGGASSPGQDHHRPHASPGVSGGVQQILPLKLSQGPSDTAKGSRMSVGYQRLASPPPSLQEPSLGHSHQRTGSSPATLQNGSPATSPGTAAPTATTAAAAAQGARATRTNTYPKLASKPSTPAQRTAESVTPEALQEGGASTNTRPGQRIKDPDTNQDIIFF